MDIPSGAWMPELEMEDPRYLTNQHQHIRPYSELGDSFFSQGGTGNYTNLETRNGAIPAVTNSKDMNEQEIYKATKTNSFTPIGGSSSNKLVMDITSDTWLPELEMEDPRYFMNQHQQTHVYGELVDSLSSQGFNGYINLVTRNESIQSPIINKDLDKQEIYKATRTNSFFTPTGGSSSNTLVKDNPSGPWLPEMEMEDPHYFMNQHQHIHPYCKLVDSFTSHGFKGYKNLVTRNEAIHATTIIEDLDEQEISKATRTNTFTPIGGSSSNTFTISFGDHNSSTEINQNSLHGGFKLIHDEVIMQPELSIEIPRRVSSTSRNPRQAQEHVLAERKRREKLTRRFISLSALLPEMKKMDNATVLEVASKYIKHLQNRVKELEETSVSGKNIIQETTTLMRSKFHGGHEDNASSFDDTNSLPFSVAYDRGIKVKISGSHTLVRIYSQRNSSLALKAITGMGSLHFIITCYNILPITENAALITIIAQMSEEFKMTAMDLVNYLQSSLSNFL